MTISADLCPVLSINTIARGVYDLWVASPGAKQARPGQFVNIKCGNFTLRRPISICEVSDKAGGSLRLVFEVRGEGTKWLAGVRAGECIDVLAPLGNGFARLKPGQKAVFVGGGIGVPPLLWAAKPFGADADILLGFRSAANVILEDDFRQNGHEVTVTTEDGSCGERGLITGPLVRRLENGPCGVICACGPVPMLRAVAQEAAKRNILCLVSMEARMGCGVGACLSCACKVDDGSGERYLHVCKNGPVFDAAEVVW